MTDPNTPDIQAIMKQAQEMQLQMQQAQEEIIASEVTGHAGNELVSITLSGGGEVRDVKIKPEAVDPEDVETLQDLIQGAFADAHQKVATLAEEKLGPFAQGAGGGDLDSLLG